MKYGKLIIKGKSHKCPYCNKQSFEDKRCCANWGVMISIAKKQFGQTFKAISMKNSRPQTQTKQIKVTASDLKLIEQIIKGD